MRLTCRSPTPSAPTRWSVSRSGRTRSARPVVDDVGTVINPLLAKGQIQGGVAQGAGQALIEDIVYARDSGQLLTGSSMDCGIPRADMVPAIAIDFSPVP